MIRCPYCHTLVGEERLAEHEARHVADRGDGQQEDYATLPPEDRADDSLDDVPQVYVHRKCGVATRMPEEIVRSYLVNPWLYSADATFCCGCGTHVPFRQCVWSETGENLQKYMDRLRAAAPDKKPQGCLGMVLLFGLLPASALAAQFV